MIGYSSTSCIVLLRQCVNTRCKMQQRRHFIFAVTAYDTVSVNEGVESNCSKYETKRRWLAKLHLLHYLLNVSI